MVGSRNKSSPIDRMWTNLVTCGVSCQSHRHAITSGVNDDGSRTPSQKTTPSGSEQEINITLQDDQSAAAEPQISPITTTSSSSHQQKAEGSYSGKTTNTPSSTGNSNTAGAESRWKGLRRILRQFRIRKWRHTSNGQVKVKLRNGKTVVIPDIIITAPDDDIVDSFDNIDNTSTTSKGAHKNRTDVTTTTQATVEE